jgi:Uma2 family endonuclease
MQPALAARRYTVEEFADLLADSETKLEFHNGVVYAMAGNSPAHARINVRLAVSLSNQLTAGSRCSIYSSDLAVALTRTNSYFFPDLSLTCEEPRFEKVKRVDAFLNPQLIVEILSPSSRDYDERVKLVAYSTLKSLRHYILIDSERIWVSVYSRASSDQLWRIQVAHSRANAIEISAPDFRLNLADLYADLDYPDTEIYEKSGGYEPQP